MYRREDLEAFVASRTQGGDEARGGRKR